MEEYEEFIETLKIIFEIQETISNDGILCALNNSAKMATLAGLSVNEFISLMWLATIK
jgi:hypothetical protein